LSNLKQWGIATNIYMVENKDWLPALGTDFTDPLTTPDPGFWYNALPGLIEAQSPYEATQDGLTMDDYRDGSGGLWFCPELDDNGTNQFHYGVNMVMGGKNNFNPTVNPKRQYTNTLQIQSATRAAWMGEQGMDGSDPGDDPSEPNIGFVSGWSGGGSPAVGATAPNDGTSRIDADRHQGESSNVLFVDGHASAFGQEPLLTFSTVYANIDVARGRPYQGNLTAEDDVEWGPYPPF
jgi:prepilin-type processing-associated H-X9-DG protein